MKDCTDAEEIAEGWANWLVAAVATATQDRQLLRGDKDENVVLTEAIYLNGKYAILQALKKTTK